MYLFTFFCLRVKILSGDKMKYCEYLKKLKKGEIEKILINYNKLCDIFKEEKIDIKGNKDSLIKNIDKIKNKYLSFLIRSLDYEDYLALKVIVKSWSDEYLNEYRQLVNYFKDMKIFFQNDNLEVPKDLDFTILKARDIIKYILKWDRIYKMASGVMIAYGVVSRKYFSFIISGIEDNELIIPKLEFYYKKDYIIDEDMIVSKKLSNKKRIDSYFKNDDYKSFTNKEYVLLGKSLYHHQIKSYKKFIKMLKNHYVFKKRDILFVDRYIVIPFLYNSLNEEDVACKDLEENIINYFEFKGDKLKNSMLKEIKKIRDDFPLWEYRGKTKEEVK